MKLDLPRASEFDAGVWYSTPASTVYPAHWHDELELNLVLWGRVQYEIGAERVELGPGSMLLMTPGQAHTLLGVSGDLAMWVASLRPSVVRDAEAASGVRLPQQDTWSTCRLPAPRVLELSQLHARLAHELRPDEVNLVARQLLAHALHCWQAHHDHTRGAPRAHRSRPLHEAVVRARALLRQPEGPPSLAVVARRSGLASGRLSRLFRQQLGLSLVQFRNHCRVQHVIGHFGRGEHTTMLDAALQCGFGSYAQFHRVFRQVTGYPPSEHIRRVRAGIVAPVPQGSRALPAER